jgi:SAM-dependent methyltransferase
MTDPVEIFSSRVRNYLLYRPGYPHPLIDLLRSECNLKVNAVVADIGCGTGLLAELFLDNGNLVYGVEPNPEMRIAAEQQLKIYPRFISVSARAEATSLLESSVDFVCAGQAFHWFDPEPTRKEFIRVLKPEGWVVLVYNIARANSTFLAAYRQFCTTYLEQTDPEPEGSDTFTPFFGVGNFTEKFLVGNRQCFDFIGLTGRVLSKAAAPDSGHPRHKAMMDALKGYIRPVSTGW